MKITVTPKRARLPRRGFTLLEVLVAIVVLSFGVLGVVGLQAMALQANKDARYQSTAVALARELGDMMRSTRSIARATSAAANPYLVNYSGGPLPSATYDCFQGPCPTQLSVAQFNMSEWLGRITAAVPGVRVVVCFDDNPYDPVTGLPRWLCDGGASGTSVVKVGWARQSTDSNANDLDRVTGGATGAPSVVLPLLN